MPECTALPGSPQARESAVEDSSALSGLEQVRECTAATDTILAPESDAVMDGTQVYLVHVQDVVSNEGSAIRRVHVSVVSKEPRFHEEAQ